MKQCLCDNLKESRGGFSWSCQTSHGTKLVQRVRITVALPCQLLPCYTSRLQHVYDHFGTARVFLQAATKLTGKQWSSRHCFCSTCAERGVNVLDVASVSAKSHVFGRNFLGPLVMSEWYGRPGV